MLGTTSKKICIGDAAPSFRLQDQNQNELSLESFLNNGPVLIVFYPGDFTPVCTKQLCNYQDSLAEFQNLGIQLVGISSNSPNEHEIFARSYNFNFPLLSDIKKAVAKEYGCTSLLMLGGISRAVIIVSKAGRVLYRYVEPTILTRRKAGELIEVVKDLKQRGQL